MLEMLVLRASSTIGSIHIQAVSEKETNKLLMHQALFQNVFNSNHRKSLTFPSYSLAFNHSHLFYFVFYSMK